MKQRDVVGCGGMIDMRCTGGCLKIHKILYSCKEKETSNREQLMKVQSLCDKKEHCTVKASRKVFGNTECPDAPDDQMKMWIVYSCDGGKDGTYLTGPTKCLREQVVTPPSVEDKCKGTVIYYHFFETFIFFSNNLDIFSFISMSKNRNTYHCKVRRILLTV